MTPEHKERWLEGLRNNRYQQGRGALRMRGDADDFSDDRFCCLGVLLDVVLPERWHDIDNISPGENVTASYNAFDDEEEDWMEGEHEHAEGELEGDLARECGIDDQQTLVQMNDGMKWTPKMNLNVGNKPGKRKGMTIDGIAYVAGKEPKDFNVIANYIEENL